MKQKALVKTKQQMSNKERCVLEYSVENQVMFRQIIWVNMLTQTDSVKEQTAQHYLNLFSNVKNVFPLKA